MGKEERSILYQYCWYTIPPAEVPILTTRPSPTSEFFLRQKTHRKSISAHFIGFSNINSRWRKSRIPSTIIYSPLRCPHRRSGRTDYPLSDTLKKSSIDNPHRSTLLLTDNDKITSEIVNTREGVMNSIYLLRWRPRQIVCRSATKRSLTPLPLPPLWTPIWWFKIKGT